MIHIRACTLTPYILRTQSKEKAKGYVTTLWAANQLQLQVFNSLIRWILSFYPDRPDQTKLVGEIVRCLVWFVRRRRNWEDACKNMSCGFGLAAFTTKLLFIPTVHLLSLLLRTICTHFPTANKSLLIASYISTVPFSFIYIIPFSFVY